MNWTVSLEEWLVATPHRRFPSTRERVSIMIEKIASDPTVQHAQELYGEAVEQKTNAIILLRHLRSNLSATKPEAMAAAQEVYGHKCNECDAALGSLLTTVVDMMEQAYGSKIESLQKQIQLLQAPPTPPTNQQ